MSNSDDECPPLAVPPAESLQVEDDMDEDIPDLIDTQTISAAAVVNETKAVNSDGPTKKIPITIITGFLGSGKSTLLDYILTEKHDFKVAVILNEFGDTGGIDQAMNVGMGVAIFNLVKPWIFRDNGVLAIENLMKKKGKFDYILLETTGLADPGPIASMFWMDDDLGSDIYLDGIVTLVDSRNIRKELELKKDNGGLNETAKQIAMADRIILNKTDLVSKQTVDELEADCKAMNGVADIVRTDHSKVDLRFVLDIAAFDAIRAKELEQANTVSNEDGNPNHVHNETCGHEINDKQSPKSNHLEASISTATLTFNTPTVDQKLFEHWLQLLLWEHQIPEPGQVEPLTGNDSSTTSQQKLDILRVKGIIKPTDQSAGTRVVIQGVQELYDIKPASTRPGQEDVINAGKVVFIGRGLEDKVKLIASCKHYMNLTDEDVSIL
ncbi:COBW domain-containing protein 1 [Entomortierella beljakovae]|nr:COBW domain-containing protein 1 [Entomortierella beljakovae]